LLNLASFRNQRKKRGAARSRRYRQRQKQNQNAVTPAVTAPAVTPSPSAHRGILPVILLCAALGVASVSAGFSIIGLTGIFVGAFWSVVGMGIALEVAKLSAVSWLGRGYSASRWLKAGIVTLVVTLMALSSIGSFGFLSRAHLDHTVAGQAVIATHAADVESRRQIAQAAINDIDKRITQVDAAVAEATRRGRTMAAMTLAERQTGRRDALVAERTRVASALTAVDVDGARVENERNELAADAGPIRYLSKLLGIDQETVLRWFIVVIAAILDPAAVCLLLAASARD
jgi:hypothetical protein